MYLLIGILVLKCVINNYNSFLMYSKKKIEKAKNRIYYYEHRNCGSTRCAITITKISKTYQNYISQSIPMHKTGSTTNFVYQNSHCLYSMLVKINSHCLYFILVKIVRTLNCFVNIIMLISQYIYLLSYQFI